MLVDMGIKVVHNFIELLMYFDFFVIWGRFTGFGLDKDDGFDGVFLDGLIALSIKEFELFVVIFFENVFGEFVMERNFGLILVNFGLFHG